MKSTRLHSRCWSNWLTPAPLHHQGAAHSEHITCCTEEESCALNIWTCTPRVCMCVCARVCVCARACVCVRGRTTKISTKARIAVSLCAERSLFLFLIGQVGDPAAVHSKYPQCPAGGRQRSAWEPTGRLGKMFFILFFKQTHSPCAGESVCAL